MSLFNNAIAGASGNQGYQIQRSVRLRSSASAYFNRTPASAGSQTTWTWSGWVKRGLLGGTYNLMEAETSSNTYTVMQFSSDNIIFDVRNGGAVVGNKYTTAVYRDSSAWYHIVFVWDTTNATASDRIRIYVNGVRVTAFGTSNDPSSSATSYGLNGAVSQRLGSGVTYPNYFDGYLTEINFIDGQALTPSSFGSTNAVTGVWQPAKYSGTYGTNGFYLNFSDNSAATAAAIGKDYSGNGNNWTPNNISVTAGVTYDSMIDTPTPYADGSTGRGNYAVGNPLAKASVITLSEANLTAATSSGATEYGVYSTIGVRTGKWYFEVKNNNTNDRCIAGFAVSGLNADNLGALATGNNGFRAYNTTANATQMIAVDMDAGKGWTGINGTWTGDPAAGTGNTYSFTAASEFIAFFGGFLNVTSLSVSANFGQRPFSYTPPSGFKALNTYNLPDSTVVNGGKYMAATLYTGTLLSNTIANAGSFKPDLVWVKSRSAATDHKLTDSVRGVTKALISDTTGAETTDTQGLTAFTSTGFTVGTDTTYNNISATYVGWQWYTNGGSSSSNTNGSITSTVSVNATAGFSIATYTGNGSAGATFGHGLGVAPKFVIVKERGNANGWLCYHVSTGNTGYLELDATLAFQTLSTVWNNTTPSSSVVTLGTVSNVNRSGGTFVAYCWSEVSGFSKFGSYTGNGSTDGPFVYCGFRPRYLLIKRTDSTGDWNIIDTSRSAYNQTDNVLWANLSNADSSGQGTDILSNGFKLRSTGLVTNASGGTFIFAAFAENPFKNALAR